MLLLDYWRDHPRLIGWQFSVAGLVRPPSGRVCRGVRGVDSYLRFGRLAVHRCVAVSHLGESELDAMHLDGDRGNARLSNLRFGSRRENLAHPLTRARARAAAFGVANDPDHAAYRDRAWSAERARRIARDGDFVRSFSEVPLSEVGQAFEKTACVVLGLARALSMDASLGGFRREDRAPEFLKAVPYRWDLD